MKNLKIKIRENLVFKIVKLRREIKIYKKKIINSILKEQEYIDKITLMQNDVRELLLKLSKEDRELWSKEKGKDYEKHTPKKKRIKR